MLNIDTLTPDQILAQVQEARDLLRERAEETKAAEDLLRDACLGHDGMVVAARKVAHQRAEEAAGEGKAPLAADIDAYYTDEMKEARSVLKRAEELVRGSRARLSAAEAELHCANRMVQLLVTDWFDSRRDTDSAGAPRASKKPEPAKTTEPDLPTGSWG